MTLPVYATVFKDDHHVVPAAALNQWRTQLPQAIDGCTGGSYAPAAPLTIKGAGIGTATVATLLEIQLGGQIVRPVGPEVADTNNQTLLLSAGQIRVFAAPVLAGRRHELSVIGATAGSWMHFIYPDGGAFAVAINRTGFAGGVDIVQIPPATIASATVYYDGTNWRLFDCDGGAVPGPNA